MGVGAYSASVIYRAPGVAPTEPVNVGISYKTLNVTK